MTTEVELRDRIKSVEIAHSTVDSVADRYTWAVAVYGRHIGAFQVYRGILRARNHLADLLLHIEADTSTEFEARLVRCHATAQEVDHSLCLIAVATVSRAKVVVQNKVPKTPLPWPFFRTEEFAKLLDRATLDLKSYSLAVDRLRPIANASVSPIQFIKAARDRRETFEQLTALHKLLRDQHEHLDNATYLSLTGARILSWTLVGCAAGLFAFVVYYFVYRAIG